jgi:hypothetical protein
VLWSGTVENKTSRYFLDILQTIMTVITYGLFSGTWNKLMVVGGYPTNHNKDVQIVDLLYPNSKCPQMDAAPIDGRRSFGTFIGEKPMICGGENDQVKHGNCYIYEKSTHKWIYEGALHIARISPGNVMINDTAWWVGASEGQKSSEVYTPGKGWTMSVDFPTSNYAYCFLKINQTHFFFSGGHYTQETFLFNTVTHSWSQLENISSGRRFGTCGVITRLSGEKEVVFANGEGKGGYSHSTEIFSFNTMKWRPGPKMPMVSDMSFGVQYGDTFLAVGGYHDNYLLDSILKYDVVHDTWIQLESRLKSSKGVYNAFLLPDDYVSCF